MCPNFYHIECIEPPITRAPRGRWICSDCKDRRDRKMNIKYGKCQNICNSIVTENTDDKLHILYPVNILVNFTLNTYVIKQFLSFNCVVSEGA